jgi:hypothetical protein
MKGNRTIRRGAIMVALGLIALALLADAALKGYGQNRLAEAQTSYENEVGTLNVQNYQLPAVPDEQNAAIWLSAGAGALIFFKGEAELVAALAARSASGLSAEDLSRVQAIVERNAGGLSILDRSRSCHSSNFHIDYASGDSAKLPPLNTFIHAAKLLRCKAALEFRRGGFEDSARTIETLGKLAASMEQERLLITLLIGIVAERLQLSALQDLAQSPAASPALLDRLRSGFSPVDLTEEYRRTMSLYGASMMEALLRGRNGDDEHSQALPWLARRNPDLAAAQFLDLQRKTSLNWRRPYPIARAARASTTRLPYLMNLLPDDLGKDRTDEVARVTSSDSNRRLARIALHLRLQSSQAGLYPPNLAAIPGAMEQDPFTGAPLHYEVHRDGSAELSSPESPDLLREFVPEPPASFYAAGCRWLLPAPAHSSH